MILLANLPFDLTGPRRDTRGPNSVGPTPRWATGNCGHRPEMRLRLGQPPAPRGRRLFSWKRRRWLHLKISRAALAAGGTGAMILRRFVPSSATSRATSRGEGGARPLPTLLPPASGSGPRPLLILIFCSPQGMCELKSQTINNRINADPIPGLYFEFNSNFKGNLLR
jgi:hypothetical protein